MMGELEKTIWTDGAMSVDIYSRGNRVWVSVYDGWNDAIELDCVEAADVVADAIHKAAAEARAWLAERETAEPETEGGNED